MYTSIYSKRETATQKGARSKISNSDQLSINALEVNVRPVLEYNAKLLNGKLVVKKILNEKTFVAYHEDYKEEFLLKSIASDENIQRWINLPPHTNIVTVFDSFVHESKQFSLCESTNAGNMYQYIDSLNLNLAINVPQSYIELIYDCIIQLTLGMEFAHNNGLIHGQFDLSNVAIVKDIDNLIFKIGDFKPITSMSMPLTSEGQVWPFARQKKVISDSEKLELLMLKDIYALGICILELMIGRISSNKFSISLDSLPLTWAEFPESTPLIQVLVECINIDSITQRKGKLQHIRRLLIKEYKRFFQRPFYKMEQPVVGNKADVCNKKAIMALNKGDHDLALQCWEEAQQMKDEHQDTQLNYLIYKWRTARISDHELIEELEKDGSVGILQGIKGIIQVAVGDKQEGVKTLKAMIDEEEKDGELKNMKIERFKLQLKEILQTIQIEKDKFYQNSRIRSDHKERVESININVNNKYFCSTSKDCVNIWSLNPNVNKLITIPLEQLEQQQKFSTTTRILATVDAECKNCAIYKGANFIFQTYTLDAQSKSFTHKDTIDLQKELARANLLQSKFDEFDVISEIKLVNDGKVLRVTQLRKKQPYLIDINLFDCTPEMKQIDKYEDKSIFKYNLTYVQYHDSLNKFINYQLSRGNLVAFPEKEFQMMLVLNREDKLNKAFMIYDIFGEQLVRKVQKEEKSLKAGIDDSDAFDVDIEGKVVIYVAGEELVFQSLRIPDPVQKYIRPRFNQALHKENPAKIASQRQAFKEKINKNLRNFRFLQPDQTKIKKECQLLMHKKVELGFKNRRIIQNNGEFLKLHKMLIKHKIPDCPLLGVDQIHKIGKFDEIKFTNDLNKIKFIEISSEIDNNYMILSIDGTVYKYDLASHEMLFSFKTQAHKGMRLFDEDTLLLAADTQQLKLWEFIHDKDDAPEMLSVLQVPLRVEQLFVNRDGEDFYFVITCKDLFEVYHSKLDKLFDGSLPNQELIKTIEFDRKGEFMYIGSQKSKIYKYNIESKTPEGDPFELEQGSFAIEMLYCLHGFKQSNVFVSTLSGKQLRVLDYDARTQEKLVIDKEYDGEVSQIRASPDAQFVFIGISMTSSFLIYNLDQQTLALTLNKRIQHDFLIFEMDEYCTQIVFLNHKQKVLELYAVHWNFDISSVDQKVYDKLDDAVVEEELGIANPRAGNTRTKGSPQKISTASRGQDSSRPKTACCSIF